MLFAIQIGMPVCAYVMGNWLKGWCEKCSEGKIMKAVTSAVDENPFVSIGMFVYNAEQFVAKSIQSILSQDYPYFELIITDNGSQDKSAEICRWYADKDQRIIYNRNETNINPLKRAVGVLDRANGTYHMWAADHDSYHPKFISSMIAQFRCAGDSVVLCYPDTCRIDVNDKPMGEVSEDVDTRGLSSVERFKKVMWGLTYCTPIYGLYLMSALKRVWKIRSITGPDRVFLPEFSLIGEYVHHKETLFFMRQNRKAENYVQNKKRQTKWFVPNNYEAIVPTVMRDYELIKIVHDTKLRNIEKEELVKEILRWHHTEPYKHSKKEVQNLVKHVMEMLSSPEKSNGEKLSSAKEYLRIADISRIFRPEMGSQIDQLCSLCNKLQKKRYPSMPEAVNSNESPRQSAGINEVCHKDNNGANRFLNRARSEKWPLVSIGMTVFNQAPFLQKTIESLLAQEYQNFELIIADNASGDGSLEVCEHYAKKDNRIRLLKNKYNLGKLANLDLVLNTSAGEFFLWASGHDLFHNKFLSLLVEEFNANDDSVVLCYPRTVYIDENDNPIHFVPDQFIDTRGMEAADRFRKTIWNIQLGNTYSGLFRTSAMKQVWQPYTIRASDHIIAAQLSLIGTIAHVNDQLFYKRKNRLAENQMVQKEKYKNNFSYTRLEAVIPYTMFAFEHIIISLNSTLKEKEKVSLVEEIKRCFQKKYRLQEEAVQFLQKGIEWLKSGLPQSNDKTNDVEELTRLTKICMLFNMEYKQGFERFAGLLCNMVQGCDNIT